jgi:NOL1/NOP2/sun family putative RNA methylase
LEKLKLHLLHKALPANFINSLAGLPGFDKNAFVDAHEDRRQVTSIRLNPAKPTPVVSSLPLQTRVPWCKDGRYLAERPSFTLDPVFHGGAYYVQEASSMFLAHVLEELYKERKKPEKVLDLCAAPGGKSTLLAASLPGSFIVSNEVIKTRVGVLAENISKWGSDNVIVTNNDPRDFKRLPGYFNLVVVDAPCSGSGLFRKDPGAIEEWSEDNVEMCSLRQQRILLDAIDCLEQEGYLVYSTCSYSKEENEDICDWIVETFQLCPVKIPVDSSWGIVETASDQHAAPGLRFYPHTLNGEGFFIACFQQISAVDEFGGASSRISFVNKQVLALASTFLKDEVEYMLCDEKEIVIASLKKWEEEYAITRKLLNVRKSGVAVGTVKGKDFIPHHELALSQLLSPHIQVSVLNKEGALRYLRRADLTIDTNARGWMICSYQHIKLGWIKVLPNRVNNYYPPNWRILKA